MTHFWFCLWTDPGQHNGCSDLTWLSDLYDYITGFVGLAAILGFTVAIMLDRWKPPIPCKPVQQPHPPHQFPHRHRNASQRRRLHAARQTSSARGSHPARPGLLGRNAAVAASRPIRRGRRGSFGRWVYPRRTIWCTTYSCDMTDTRAPRRADAHNPHGEDEYYRLRPHIWHSGSTTIFPDLTAL